MVRKRQKPKTRARAGRETPLPERRKESNPGKTLLFSIVLSAAYIVLMLIALQLSYEKPRPPAAVPVPAQAADTAYRNPEFEKMKNLKTGGTIERKLPVVDRLKFTMSDKPLFDGADPVYSLNVCCQGGTPREYYTCKMPWAFIMYEYESGVPTVTVFEIRSEAKTGRYEIIVMDPQAELSVIKAVSVSIYEELLRQYMPGFTWRGSVRQEIN